MNKSLVMGGVVALALASCTQNEVLEVNDSRAIGFESFVNNNTRASEINKTNFEKFNVFGYHGENVPDYTNVLVNKTKATWTPEAPAYWQKNQEYEFAAYSDGNASLTDGVTFANKTLSFTGYTVGEKDLIAAHTSVAAQEDVNSYGNVTFNFYHMLSQIKFTFQNGDTRDYVMKISELKILAGKTGNATYTVASSTPSITWTSTKNEEYTVPGIEDIAEGELNKAHSTESIFIMPQVNDNLNVTFTVTLSDSKGGQIAQGNFTAPLDIDAQATDSKWAPGFRYNYTATINGKDVPVDPTYPETKPVEIKFTVDQVDGWEDAESDPTKLKPVPQP